VLSKKCKENQEILENSHEATKSELVVVALEERNNLTMQRREHYKDKQLHFPLHNLNCKKGTQKKNETSSVNLPRGTRNGETRVLEM
jgi:hypothetical protein